MIQWQVHFSLCLFYMLILPPGSLVLANKELYCYFKVEIDCFPLSPAQSYTYLPKGLLEGAVHSNLPSRIFFLKLLLFYRWLVIKCCHHQVLFLKIIMNIIEKFTTSSFQFLTQSWQNLFPFAFWTEQQIIFWDPEMKNIYYFIIFVFIIF